ncbi:reverse transcriptase domain-containing protein [Citrus sinensis]|uniref:Reverse transcriptase domain-containing protein n=1 Tax=Citrus sinensis TaxID=2711 RepID=A0ACB8M078_CITSI|nr:reverse transcriptase domain-containing protein [Citrus sinensis]
MTSKQMQEKASKMKFQNYFSVSREGLGGGLAMLWNPGTTVEIKSFSKHHVDAVVCNENGNYWRCTGVYGHPESDQKRHTWELFRRLATLSSLQWLCFGDFNEVLNLNEKLGGRDKRVNMVNEFRKAIRDCDLKDLGSIGYPFTWSNRRFGHHIIEEKLNRFLKKNWTSGLEDENGKWLEEVDDVERMVCEYFTNIFTTTNPSSGQISTTLSNLPAKVTREMGSFMDQLFTKEDKHWGSVQQDVITTCLHVLNEGGNIAPLNHTYLALIPKVQKPRKVTDFRPISLCNVIYRIIAKTLANRLKKILHVIISPNQSAFVPNRLITDNLIIGYECLNKIRQSKSKRNGLVALKLDISKAYNRVEWEFGKCTMQKLGFSEKWVKLIMNCITTASFSVLINGVAKGLIHPQRGLRQGCPLSPYLFIMCAEVFSNLMVNAENQNLINGLKCSSLKTGYFKHTDFMEAKLGSNPSFVWRSILWGRQGLHKGLRWRIGNGNRVSVSSRNWMQKLECSSYVPHQNLAENAVVADFIDDKNQWMEEKVVQCFPEEVAQRILRTPLPRTPQEDLMIWHFDKYGCYSVRSGYQVAVRMKFPDNPECSDSSKTQWKNLLPTANNLWRKNVVGNPACQRCNCKSENVTHVLMECKAAQKVWKLTDFYEDMKLLSQHDILSMLQELASRRTKKEIEQILAIYWAIWYARNRFVIEGKQEEPKLAAARASAIVESYKRIKTQNGPARSIHFQNNQQIWTPPPEGKYKVNVDVAIQMAGLKAGLGAVVRNSNGKIIAAAVKKVCFQGTVASMEAEAVLFGIQVAQQVEYLPMIIESDSTEVVELVWSRKSSLTEVSWTVEEIKQQLQISNASSLQFVPRKCNAIAHAIAKVALDFENSVIWLEEFPVQIMMLLSNFIN